MKNILISSFALSFLCFYNTAFADDSAKVAELEAQVKDLSQRLSQIEGQLKQVKGGGFTIVPVTNCELTTPFDGNYTASELSKAAAKTAVIEKCKEKANNKNECFESRVVCH